MLFANSKQKPNNEVKADPKISAKNLPIKKPTVTKVFGGGRDQVG